MSKISTAVAASLLATIVATPIAASAAPLAPTKPSQVVTVAVTSGSTPCPDNIPTHHFVASVLLTSSGTVVPFAIPPKSVFVATSYDYALTSTSPGTSAGAGIFAAAAGQAGFGAASTAAVITDSAGRATGTTLIPNGLVVKPPAVLCGEFATGVTGTIYVHGFFAKDK